MRKELIDKNPILKLSFEFSLMIIEYCEKLEESRKYIISRQLLRAATSIGANVFEAQNCESKADFIHKIKIAAKEADETQYWLLLCYQMKESPESNQLLEKLTVISRILNKILATSKAKKAF